MQQHVSTRCAKDSSELQRHVSNALDKHPDDCSTFKRLSAVGHPPLCNRGIWHGSSDENFFGCGCPILEPRIEKPHLRTRPPENLSSRTHAFRNLACKMPPVRAKKFAKSSRSLVKIDTRQHRMFWRTDKKVGAVLGHSFIKNIMNFVEHEKDRKQDGRHRGSGSANAEIMELDWHYSLVFMQWA